MNLDDAEVIIIGYSGHAYVAIDIITQQGGRVSGYCDNSEKPLNPYHLPYLGPEPGLNDDLVKNARFFIGIGSNQIRSRVYAALKQRNAAFINARHPSSVIATSVMMGEGVMVAAGAVINPLVKIGKGVICNTNSSIDHECIIGDFAHIAPGAVLCGNVTVGESVFIGAGAIIKEGITIGNNVIVGAGSVVIRDIPSGVTVVGCPASSKQSKNG